MGQAGFARRWQEGRRLIHDNGITYNVYSDPQSTARPWPLDPIPLVMDRAEWKAIEAAIDPAGDAAQLRSWRISTGRSACCAKTAAAGTGVSESGVPAVLLRRAGAAGGVYLHIYSADLARSPDGRWWVIADRTQAPSGAGYALENRLVSARVMPDVFRAAHVRRLANFFQTYRETPAAAGPRPAENPRIVVLTPGPYNETYFEHAFLARYLGYTLVEGGDLTVRDNRVFLKTLGGLLPVDVIVRRQDDNFCDPLELRSDSMLGVPGLVQAVRSGTVSVANALGSGLVESAAPASFLPGLCRQLLGEELKMPTVATWWCGEEPRARLCGGASAKLVIKPTFPRPECSPSLACG